MVEELSWASRRALAAIVTWRSAFVVRLASGLSVALKTFYRDGEKRQNY